MSSPRPLAGCVVGISISESDDLHRLGFDRDEMNRCIVRLSESFLAAGARLAFGHDWRPGGVMEAVAALAVRHFDLGWDAKGHTISKDAPIINRVAPPDLPFLSEQENQSNPILRHLDGVVDARQVQLSASVGRKEALSLMRQQLAELCDVRLCLGGKITDFKGKLPGVIEEAFYTLALERPVFASGIFGGASILIAKAIDNNNSEDLRLPHSYDCHEEFALIKQNSHRLQPAMNQVDLKRLMNSFSIDECIELMLRGTIKWWNDRHARG